MCVCVCGHTCVMLGSLVANDMAVTVNHCTTLHHTTPPCNTSLHTATDRNKYHSCILKVSHEMGRAATHLIPLQHTATHCNTLLNTPTHASNLHPHSRRWCNGYCNTLRHTTTRCNKLQHTVKKLCDTNCTSELEQLPMIWWVPQYNATCCNTLQHTATNCNTLQHMPAHQNLEILRWYGGCCNNTLQHTTTHYNTYLQTHIWKVAEDMKCAATHYNTLQRTAPYCNSLQHIPAHLLLNSLQKYGVCYVVADCTARIPFLCCSVLQCGAVYCRVIQCVVLQWVAVCCSVVQHCAVSGVMKWIVQPSFIPA